MAGRSGTIKSTAKAPWRQWIVPFATIGMWCTPAALINLAHGLEAGREPALIVAAVFAVLGAAMCGLRLEAQGSMAGKLVTALCLVVLISFNFSNAIGLSAGHRDHERSEALSAQTAVTSLQDDKRTITGTIARLNSELGASSISSLKAEIAARERSLIFDRTKSCTDATVPESRDHCAAWDKARAMLKAAERREQLQAELTRINEQLRAAPVRESVDPQSEAVARAFAFAGIAVEPRDAGYALALLFAAAVELMAAFGASWCGVRLPSHGDKARPETERRSTTVAQDKPGKPAAPAHSEPLTAFLDDLVERRANAFQGTV